MTRRIGVAPQDCGDPEVTWLTARAVALLVLLRAGKRSIVEIARSLGESRSAVVALVTAPWLGLWTYDGSYIELTDEGRDWIARSGCSL